MIRIRGKYLAFAAGLAFILMLGHIWYALFSEIGYQAPEDLPAVDPNVEHRVFAYGTLRFSPVRWLVIGQHATPQPARIENFRREGLNIEPALGEQLEGVVFTVSAEQLRQLDRYERLGVKYQRIRLPLHDGTRAWVYQLKELPFDAATDND